MLTALYETKKARFVKSDSFRELGVGKKRKNAINEVVRKDVEASREAILSVLNIAKDGDDDLLMAVYEAFETLTIYPFLHWFGRH